MNVLQHTRNELNLGLKQNRPDRSYRDTLLILKVDIGEGPLCASAIKCFLEVFMPLFFQFLTSIFSDEKVVCLPDQILVVI